ncbi:MAG: HINT domain-containing protein [Sandaracinaceae bacterium]|nr:HINT domain-containing protein [Sandaracinaceae bacterium]
MIAEVRLAFLVLSALLAMSDAVVAEAPSALGPGTEVIFERTVHAADGVVALEVGPESGPIETIEATREHPFWARSSVSAMAASSVRPGVAPRDGWVPAGELRPGDEIFTSTGGWIRVHGNTWISREQLVYNLDVEGADTFFVGQSGAWVHNACTAAQLALNKVNGDLFRDEVGDFLRAEGFLVRTEVPFFGGRRRMDVMLYHPGTGAPLAGIETKLGSSAHSGSQRAWDDLSRWTGLPIFVIRR